MLEHLQQTKRGNYGPGNCKVQFILESLDDKDRDILLTVLDDVNNYSTHGIFAGLRSAGLMIGYGTLDRHRKNLCACGVSNAG